MSVTAAAKDRGPNERPPICGEGVVVAVHKPGHVYEVEMGNGHRAYAVSSKEDASIYQMEDRVYVEYSPYDMTRCKITRPAN